jgi:hypothetical protein
VSEPKGLYLRLKPADIQTSSLEEHLCKQIKTKLRQLQIAEMLEESTLETPEEKEVTQDEVGLGWVGLGWVGWVGEV